jgi:hypothetical protein
MARATIGFFKTREPADLQENRHWDEYGEKAGTLHLSTCFLFDYLNNSTAPSRCEVARRYISPEPV